MELSMLGGLVGGIGLFLLGMKMMTDGLRLAAGKALRHILSEWTKTPLRGLFSGVMITSLVQSSSAVTVATIGFVNAGLLDILQTVYVIYGSNIGTTMTSWLVAMVGFKIKVDALALPMIGIGMALRLFDSMGRKGAFGEALAGFGLFFLGIDILKETFAASGQAFSLSGLPNEGWGMLLFVGIGFTLTFLMQSSSAAMVVILSAVAGGLVTIEAAAAAVIGANVGTTSTAALSVIGATPNAKRTAAAHVIFNLITALVAVILLIPMIKLVSEIQVDMGLEDSPAVLLALFHSVFNVMGVLLLWFVTPRMVNYLKRRFRSFEEDEGRPRYLDKTVLAAPDLALNALIRELERIGAIARDMSQAALSTEKVASGQLLVHNRVVQRLVEAVGDFGVTMQRANLTQDIVDAIPDAMRVARYYQAVANHALDVAHMQQDVTEIHDPRLADIVATFRSNCVRLLKLADASLEDFSLQACDEQLNAIERAYQELKAAFLRAGANERIRVPEMVNLLDQYSRIRRMVEQMAKAAHFMNDLFNFARKAGQQEEPGQPAETAPPVQEVESAQGEQAVTQEGAGAPAAEGAGAEISKDGRAAVIGEKTSS